MLWQYLYNFVLLSLYTIQAVYYLTRQNQRVYNVDNFLNYEFAILRFQTKVKSIL